MEGVGNALWGGQLTSIGYLGMCGPKGCGKLFLKLNAISSTCVLSVNENDDNILQSVEQLS